MTDGLTAYYLTVDSGSLTVTGDPQAITLANQALGDLQMGDGVRLFTGSSAQDAAEAVIPQLSAEMQELYQRYLDVYKRQERDRGNGLHLSGGGEGDRPEGCRT